MKGACLINNIDIYESFGAFILKGSLNDLICFPSRKTPLQNNWFESKSLDIDLSETFFDEKKVSIRFLLKRSNSLEYMNAYEHFFNLLTNAKGIEVYIRELDSLFKLRYVDCADFKQYGRFKSNERLQSEIEVTFSMDDPISGLFEDLEDLYVPNNDHHSTAYFALNELDLARYGIIVEKAYSSIFKYPQPKSILVRKFERRSGQWADTTVDHYNYESKTISLQCAMVSSSFIEFRNNYKYLFQELTKPGVPLELFSNPTGNTIDCFYKDMTDFSKLTPFVKKEKMICRFTLNFVCLDSGIKEIEFLLSSEEGLFIETEDGLFIDIA